MQIAEVTFITIQTQSFFGDFSRRTIIKRISVTFENFTLQDSFPGVFSVHAVRSMFAGLTQPANLLDDQIFNVRQHVAINFIALSQNAYHEKTASVHPPMEQVINVPEEKRFSGSFLPSFAHA